jgi:Flp pilus assembly pilin Flp
MRTFLRIVGRALASRRGQSIVEYALILALVVIAVVAALTSLGAEAPVPLQNVSNTLANAT